MNESIKERLTALRAEFDKGQKRLGELEAQQSDLRSKLLRISGAIQVLEELLEAGQDATGAR